MSGPRTTLPMRPFPRKQRSSCSATSPGSRPSVQRPRHREAGLAAGPVEAAPDGTFDTASPDTAPADGVTPAQAHAGDDLSRIFEETDSHLGTSASSRRRNAIQHLRAALAATRAETRTSSQPRRDRDDPQGRAGPRAAARLRRARAASQRGPAVQSSERTPDPLRLTAEQRIDMSQGRRTRAPFPRRPSQPPRESALRPRRISVPSSRGWRPPDCRS